MQISIPFGGQGLPAIEIPVNPQDFTKPSIDALRRVLIPDELAASDLQVWTGIQRWLEAMTTTNGPLPNIELAVRNDQPMRLWSVRNTWNSMLPKVAEFRRNPDGTFVSFSITANTAGGNTGANPETYVAPGQLLDANMASILGPSGAYLMLAERGGYFEADGIPQFAYRGYNLSDLLYPNFGGASLGFTQLPMQGVGFGPWPQGWFAFFIPGSGRKRIAIAKIEDISRLPINKPGGGQQVLQGVTYANSEAAVGAFAIALAGNPSATPAGVGPAIAEYARRTK